MYMITSPENKDLFLSYLLSLLFALESHCSKTLDHILNRDEGNGPPCLSADFAGNVLSFLPFSMMLGCMRVAFITLCRVASIPSLFLTFIIKECYNLCDCCPCVHLYDVLHLLDCIHSTVPESLE